MPTATLPQLWRGRSGRDYVPAEMARVRHGGMATVRKVLGKGGPVGSSSVDNTVPLALKLWTESDDASLDQLQAEAKVLVEVSRHQGELPCPRLYDLVGQPLVTGIVMEWCPADLERWWREKLKEPDAFGRLSAALAEVCRRLADYHEFFAQKLNQQAAHGDLKPSNILLSAEGRWLISDFGAARVRPPDDNPLVTSKVVAGTENFLSPEALFHASRKFPAAMDTWALGATLFSLLRLQRLVLDNSQIPRNGTQSPRFRMQRINQIHEVYGRDPTRFSGRELDPEAFPDPLRLPEEDRRAVRDSLRGVFGGKEDAHREEQLARELHDILDRAMSIDPKHRFTDARDLAAIFERLTRVYIELSTPSGTAISNATPAPAPSADRHATPPASTPAPIPDVPGVTLVSPPPAQTGQIKRDAVREASLLRAKDEMEERARQLQEEVERLREKLAESQARAASPDDVPTRIDDLATPRPAPATAPPPAPIVVGPPGWWGFALVLSLLFHGLTLVLLAIVLVLSLAI